MTNTLSKTLHHNHSVSILSSFTKHSSIKKALFGVVCLSYLAQALMRKPLLFILATAFTILFGLNMAWWRAKKNWLRKSVLRS